MPIIGAKGSPSSGGFGQFAQASGPANYIEDVFSTWLYTGNGSTQTINNGIDLAGKGGLVWIKRRNGVENHLLKDTVRGSIPLLSTNTTSAEINNNYGVAYDGFNSNGFTAIGDNFPYASWTFRKQPKFFDVVTFTTGTSLSTNRRISHSLGSVPGCILVKRTTGAQSWLVYHRSTGRNAYLLLDTTEASTSFTNAWGTSDPTSTDFGINEDSLCFPSSTYVAYLFAHNAGGFGLSGTDNVISCGSFTTNGSGVATVDLGYEPQWVLVKPVSGESNMDWRVMDNMRGITVDNAAVLRPNSSAAEFTSGTFKYSINGFTSDGLVNSTQCVYIAIRRGPMKVPTSGTSVFAPAVSAGSTGTKITTDFPVDLQFSHSRSFSDIWWWADRLRGMNSPGLSSNSPYLSSNNTNTEATSPGVTNAWDNNSFSLGSAFSGQAQAYFNLRRAPGFFDEVCYTGNGSTQNISHNLGVVPEMMIAKRRDVAGSWVVYTTTTGNAAILELSSTGAVQTSAPQWNSTTPTASMFSLGTSSSANASGSTYVWYGFATCAGVSKVGSYTGNGATQTINCDFTGGARFVLIKRTDSAGDWYVYDTARGMTTLTDPYLLLNSTAAESATLGSVTTVSTGFALNAGILAAINTTGASYLFLAIA